MKALQALFLVYTAALFLLHALSPFPFLAPSVFVALLALFMIFASPLALEQLQFRRDDAAFGAIYLFGLVSFLLNPAGLKEQNYEYATLWLGIWTICFWWVREWALASQVSFNSISKAAAVGAAILSIGIIVEFVMVNTTGLYLSDYIPFSEDEFPFANILGTSFIRPRGFSAEPGFSAIVFNCLIPISAYYLLRDRRKLVIFSAIILPGYILLGSAASMMCLLITAAVFVLIINRSLLVLFVSGGVAMAVGFAFVVSDAFQAVYQEIIGRKIDALLNPLSTDVGSYSRSEAYRYGFRILRDHPMGIGWGEFSQRHNSAEILSSEIPKGSGLLSIPLEIAVAGGLIAVALYFYILYRKLKPLMVIDDLAARVTFFSLLWVALHHMFVLELWFPMLWFSLALADVVRIRQARAAQLQSMPGAWPVATSLGSLPPHGLQPSRI